MFRKRENGWGPDRLEVMNLVRPEGSSHKCTDGAAQGTPILSPACRTATQAWISHPDRILPRSSPTLYEASIPVGQKIERDLQRFRKIVRGKVKSNLSKYIGRGEMIGKKGNDLVSIPLPSIEIPQFRYGSKGSGGVGVGEGQVGSALDCAKPARRARSAGDQPGGHILEVELTMEELAAILGEELALPRIEPRGKKNIVTEKRQVHQHPPSRARIAHGTSSALTSAP